MTIQHGTQSGYNNGCRETCCRTAHAAMARAYRRRVAYGRQVPRSIPSVGTRRRLEALQTLGWSLRDLSRKLGCHPDRLSVMLVKQDGVSPRNATRIAAMYDQLWDKPAPTRTTGQRISASRTIARAQRLGFIPPLAWDDDEIDDPAAQPYLPSDGIRELAPCGTTAAARRHYRLGEPLDEACRNAERREKNDRAARRRAA